MLRKQAGVAKAHEQQCQVRRQEEPSRRSPSSLPAVGLGALGDPRLAHPANSIVRREVLPVGQRSLGNDAVQRLLARGVAHGGVVRPVHAATAIRVRGRLPSDTVARGGPETEPATAGPAPAAPTAAPASAAQVATARAGAPSAAWPQPSAEQRSAILEHIRGGNGQAALTALWSALSPGLSLAGRITLESTDQPGVVDGQRVGPGGGATAMALTYVPRQPGCAGAPPDTHWQRHTANDLRALMQVNPGTIHGTPEQCLAQLYSTLMHEYTHVEQRVAQGLFQGLTFLVAGEREFLSDEQVPAQQRELVAALDEIDAYSSEIERAGQTGLGTTASVRTVVCELWAVYQTYFSRSNRQPDPAVATRVHQSIERGRVLHRQYLRSPYATPLPPRLQQFALTLYDCPRDYDLRTSILLPFITAGAAPAAAAPAPSAGGAEAVQPVPRLPIGRQPLQGLIQAKPEQRPAAVPRPARPAKALDLLKAQYPHLARVMPPQQVVQVQQVLDAQFRIQQLAEQAAPYRRSILSEDVRRREAIERQIQAQQDIVHEKKDVFVPTAKLLAADVMPKGEDRPKVASFKELLYKQMCTYPVRLSVQEGASPEPLFALSWGRHGWEIGHSGGQIRFQDLMRIEKFNLDYQHVLLGEQAVLASQMAEARRSLGGKLYDMAGKKVGEIWGRAWNTSVRVGEEVGSYGGYYDDQRGRAQVFSELVKRKGSRIVLRAPDKWLHIYSLRPNLYAHQPHSGKLTSPDNDGYVYLLDKGRQVPDVFLIETDDHMVLEQATNKKAGPGWRTRETGDRIGTIEQVAMGGFFGDALEDPSVDNIVGQVLVGVIPVVGQIADARDVALGIRKMWRTGGKDGKLQTALALVGLIPLLGDAIKWAVKRARKGSVAKVLKEAAPDIERNLGRQLANDPIGVARRFNLPAARFRRARQAGAAAEQAAADPVSYVQHLTRVYQEVGGNVAAMVSVAGGRWQHVAQRLVQATRVAGAKPGADALISSMQQWRRSYFQNLPNALQAEIGRLRAPGTNQLVGPPNHLITGTRSISSDLDMSFLGANATMYRNAAERHLEARLGRGWRELMDADIFVDPRRMHLFSELPPKFAKRAEKEMVRESELNVLAKMIRSGEPMAEVQAFAKKLGVPMRRVEARAKEIAELAAPLEKVRRCQAELTRLERLAGSGTEAQRAAAGRRIAEARGRLQAAQAELNRSPYRRMELQMDVLHQRFLSETNPRAKAAIAEEMAATQSKLNAAVQGPYVTPGGTYKHVTARERELRRGVPFAPMSTRMGYMALLDDLYMLTHVQGAIATQGLSATAAKSLLKYADRLIITAGQHGVDLAKARQARQLFDNVEALLATARRDPARLTEGSARGYFRQAVANLEQQIDLLLGKVKQRESRWREIWNRARVVLRAIRTARRGERRQRQAQQAQE